MWKIGSLIESPLLDITLSLTPIKNNYLSHAHSLWQLKNQLWPTAGSQFQKHPQMAWYNKALALICMSEENFVHGPSRKFSQNFLWIDLQFINRAPSKSDSCTDGDDNDAN